ncbi:TetR/AcrR family transcriptional regulator [Actinoplanes sp. NPDC051411]|uniref:TetR/AcrR family transcriptional regulator n=1 Tax=Actinoplanes sp. NPDC051411 TaxID=3155522 RepID=UPI00342BF7DD
MPTGIALRDVRAQLFDAAERVLLRDGPSALTSRAVTTEAGVAKGVLHRHFTDFDDFLAALIEDRSARVAAQADELLAAAGTGTVAGNLTTVLTSLFTSVAVGVMSLIIFRDELRVRLKASHPNGIPLLSAAGTMIASYLLAERSQGRLSPSADIDALGLALIGSGHLLFAARSGDPSLEVSRVVAGILAGSLR